MNNTKAENLSQLEARGRLFATTLLDAGFSASEVRDAAFIPSARIAARESQMPMEATHDLRRETFADLTVNESRKRCRLPGESSLAFVAGVLAVIEERA